jgi:hypothetical protein
VLSGASATPIAQALGAAQTLFAANKPDDVGKLKKEQKVVWISLASLLDRYNNGFLGVPHCD